MYYIRNSNTGLYLSNNRMWTKWDHPSVWKLSTNAKAAELIESIRKIPGGDVAEVVSFLGPKEEFHKNTGKADLFLQEYNVTNLYYVKLKDEDKYYTDRGEFVHPSEGGLLRWENLEDAIKRLPNIRSLSKGRDVVIVNGVGLKVYPEGDDLADQIDKSISKQMEKRKVSTNWKKKFKTKRKEMKNLVRLQGQSCPPDCDEYMRGMYNGMELMLSVMEGRNPQYMDAPEKGLLGKPEDDFHYLIKLPTESPYSRDMLLSGADVNDGVKWKFEDPLASFWRTRISYNAESMLKTIHERGFVTAEIVKGAPDGKTVECEHYIWENNESDPRTAATIEGFTAVKVTDGPGYVPITSNHSDVKAKPGITLSLERGHAFIAVDAYDTLLDEFTRIVEVSVSSKPTIRLMSANEDHSRHSLFLFNAFSWQNSFQGYNYWRDIYGQLVHLEKQMMLNQNQHEVFKKSLDEIPDSPADR